MSLKDVVRITEYSFKTESKLQFKGHLGFLTLHIDLHVCQGQVLLENPSSTLHKKNVIGFYFVYSLIIFIEPKILIEDITWRPSGLSVQPKVENLAQEDTVIKYECGDEQLEGDYKYSDIPHTLPIKGQAIKGQRILKATAEDKYGNTDSVKKNLPEYQGKFNVCLFVCVLILFVSHSVKRHTWVLMGPDSKCSSQAVNAY